MAAKKDFTDNFEHIKDSTLDKMVLLAVAYISFGAVVYHYIENLSWVDSFYFVVISLGTVGYGDITPKTTGGRVFTIFFVIIGIVIFIGLAKAVFLKVARKRAKRKRK